MLCVELGLWPMRPVHVVARSAAVVCLLSFTYSSIKSRFTASNRRHEDQSTSQLHVAPPGSRMSRMRTIRFTSCRKCYGRRSVTRCERKALKHAGRRYYRMTERVRIDSWTAINMVGDSWPQPNESVSTRLQFCLPPLCSAGA